MPKLLTKQVNITCQHGDKFLVNITNVMADSSRMAAVDFDLFCLGMERGDIQMEDCESLHRLKAKEDGVEYVPKPPRDGMTKEEFKKLVMGEEDGKLL